MSEDPFWDDRELDSERLARENMDSDLRFLARLRMAGDRLEVSGRVKKAIARNHDDPRLSDIRRYAHALGIRVSHTFTTPGNQKAVLSDAAESVLRAHSNHPLPGEEGFDNDALAWAEALAKAAINVYESRMAMSDPQRRNGE